MKFLSFIAIMMIANVSQANIVCQTAKVDRKDPSKYLERCYLGMHKVKISKRAESKAFINECRFKTRNGTSVVISATDNHVTDINVVLQGVDLGFIPKLKSGDQFGFAISNRAIGDGEMIECATVVGKFEKYLKY